MRSPLTQMSMSASRRSCSPGLTVAGRLAIFDVNNVRVRQATKGRSRRYCRLQRAGVSGGPLEVKAGVGGCRRRWPLSLALNPRFPR